MRRSGGRGGAVLDSLWRDDGRLHGDAAHEAARAAIGADVDPDTFVHGDHGGISGCGRKARQQR